MPSLTIQVSPHGPVVDVAIGVSGARKRALEAAGQSVPVPVTGRFLIDTGASHTMIDDGIIGQLALVQTGSLTIHTPSSGAAGVQKPTFDIWLTLSHPVLSRNFDGIPVCTHSFAAQGIHGLFGRDLLAACLLHYNGEMGFFSLSF